MTARHDVEIPIADVGSVGEEVTYLERDHSLVEVPCPSPSLYPCGCCLDASPAVFERSLHRRMGVV